MDEVWVRWILGGLGALIVTVFGAMLRRLFNRQDELEKNKANEASVDRRFDELQQVIRDHLAEDRSAHGRSEQKFDSIGNKLDTVSNQIGITNATLANLAGRFEEARRNGNGAH